MFYFRTRSHDVILWKSLESPKCNSNLARSKDLWVVKCFFMCCCFQMPRLKASAERRFPLEVIQRFQQSHRHKMAVIVPYRDRQESAGEILACSSQLPKGSDVPLQKTFTMQILHVSQYVQHRARVLYTVTGAATCCNKSGESLE